MKPPPHVARSARSAGTLLTGTLLTSAVLAIGACGSNFALAPDQDNDGLSDNAELALGTDPLSPDTDRDGLTDAAELNGNTSPIDADSDNDGLPDGTDENAAQTLIAETTTTSDNAPLPPDTYSTGNDIEPNDRWEEAVNLPLHADVGARLTGRMNHAADVDIFRLGTIPERSRVMFAPESVTRQTLRLALFDAQGILHVLAAADSPFSFDLTGSHDATYLALVPGTESRSVDYEIGVTGVPVTGSANTLSSNIRQVIYLEFDGGSPQRPILGISHLAPFEASHINPNWQEHTESMKEMIVDFVEERFAPFNITIMWSDDAPPPREASRIVIGSGPAPAYGAAQGIDVDNRNCCDDGLVFIDAFETRAFWPRNSREEMSLAIAQVVAHEIGHLLGLHHVHDPTAIMDEASPSIFLTYPQTFKTAPRAHGVFPIGSQDSRRHLMRTVGPSR